MTSTLTTEKTTAGDFINLSKGSSFLPMMSLTIMLKIVNLDVGNIIEDVVKRCHWTGLILLRQYTVSDATYSMEKGASPGNGPENSFVSLPNTVICAGKHIPPILNSLGALRGLLPANYGGNPPSQ